MTDTELQARMMDHLKKALTLADQLGMRDVAIGIDSAINCVDRDSPFLRDSATRIWFLPD